jgi:hypothetical protein
LTGEAAGQPLSREIGESGAPTQLCNAEGNTEGGAYRESPEGSTRSKTLRMRRNPSHGNWDVSSEPGAPGMSGKAHRRKPDMDADEKSDACIVPMNGPNNGDRREAKGDVIVVRYADDSVVGFEFPEDARAFLASLRNRLGQFGLSLNEAKTRILEFGRYAVERRARRGQRRPETFDFLGFTHICGTRRSNRSFIVRRLTTAKRMVATLKAIRASLMRRRHMPTKVVGPWLQRVVQGYLNYHAVPGNLKRLGMFRAEVCRAWMHALRRRSQRSRTTWERFKRLVALYIPKVRAQHPYPNQRFAS